MKNARRVAALAGAALLVLTGCAQSPSTAAVVGGVVLPESEVDQATPRVSQLVQGNGRLTTVYLEISGMVATKVADAKNIPLTDADRQMVFGQNRSAAALASDPTTALVANRFADTVLVVQKLGEDGWYEACSKVSVTLNPRYGSWSKEQCAPDGDPSVLSKPAATKQP